MGVQATIGIDHADDDRVRIEAGEALTDDGEGVVEGLALALAGVGQNASQYFGPRIPDRLDDITGSVIADVIDDHDMQPGIVDVEQALHRGGDDLGLVEARHENDYVHTGIEGDLLVVG